MTDEPTTDGDALLLPGTGWSPSRRAFLQMSGFGIAAGVLAGCSRGPVQRAVAQIEGSREFAPGQAYWIATTCQGCTAACGVLARCRDGRPVKVEGNPLQALSRGGLCAVGQAQILSLYDAHRSDGPLQAGQASTWHEVDAEIARRLQAAHERGGQIRLLTGTLHSPSTLATIAGFLQRLPGARHVMYDALSCAAILDAHERTHGQRVLPAYRFERARVIAAFDCDFLGTWIAPVEHAAGYAAGRSLEGTPPRMSRHHQLEARVSLTGSRADERTLLAPWEVAGALAALCELLAARAGEPPPIRGALAAAPARARIEALAERLDAARGESLVVAGSNDLGVQLLVNQANLWLGNYGSTLDLERASFQRRGDDRALVELRSELERGEVDVLVVAGANPAYDLPGGWSTALGGVRTLVSCAPLPDETSAAAHFVLPEPHGLERWDDAEPERGRYALSQPTVGPLRAARTLRCTLARWMGDAREDRELVRDHWRQFVYPLAGTPAPFERFWHQALHDGWIELPAAAGPVGATGQALALVHAGASDLSMAAGPVGAADTFAALVHEGGIGLPADGGRPRWRGDDDGPLAAVAPPGGTLGLVLYPKVAMLDGRHAHNPWLQELPDPVTKITWDNYACLSPARAERLGVGEGERLSLRAEDGTAVELPVHVQVGQHDDVVCVALGYGRQGTDRFAGIGPGWLQGRATVEPGATVGVNGAPFLAVVAGRLRPDTRAVRAERAPGRVDLACTQDHHSLQVPPHLAPPGGEVREAVRVVSLAALAQGGRALEGRKHEIRSLWEDDHEPRQHRWALAIDLTRCTGCSACVVACQSENNVPVVGRDEVRRHREMHWLRIDRYWRGGSGRADHQPMLCQHCANAPCESVCPVLATVHSSEGLNQQVYNRCVGTRYCANTCPYKVRRFNWFDYAREDELQNLALNPDVTVRTRGVMEKCSFCVQRIQESKARARVAGRPLADGEVLPACQQSCPAQAIVFGDLLEGTSAVARMAASPRAYRVLEQLNVRPSISYLARVEDGGSPEERREG